jgi:predicted ATPase
LHCPDSSGKVASLNAATAKNAAQEANMSRFQVFTDSDLLLPSIALQEFLTVRDGEPAYRELNEEGRARRIQDIRDAIASLNRAGFSVVEGGKL